MPKIGAVLEKFIWWGRRKKKYRTDFSSSETTLAKNHNFLYCSRQDKGQEQGKQGEKDEDERRETKGRMCLQFRSKITKNE